VQADNYAEWVAAFFDAVAAEAADQIEMMRTLQRGWVAARGKTSQRRRNSRAAQAVDLLAAAPLLSATTLARAIGMSIKCAGELLDQFVTEGIAVEVTHRSARRLFGLAGLAPLRDAVQAPHRPDPQRRRGRPSLELAAETVTVQQTMSPLERRSFDYADLDAAMAELDAVIKDTRRTLQTILQ
jgi:hypothetical protein